MSVVALRPSQPPDVHALRAKAIGKLRHPRRQEARARGALAMYRAARHVSDAELGEHVGGANDGATVRTGAMVLTTHEAVLLLPLSVGGALAIDALRDRVTRDITEATVDKSAALRMALVLTHISAIEALLSEL